MRAKSSITLGTKAARETTTMVALLAPHFTVTPSGLLLRLRRREGYQHQELARHLQFKQQIYLPPSAMRLRSGICHGVRMQPAHPRALKTYQIMQKASSWGGMYSQVADVVKRCAICQYLPQHRWLATLQQQCPIRLWHWTHMSDQS